MDASQATQFDTLWTRCDNPLTILDADVLNLIKRAPFINRQHGPLREGLLHVCCKHGHLDILTELVALFDINVDCRNIDDDTALHYAARRRFINEALLLLNAGADVNATNSTRDTALHLAVKAADSTLCEALISKGANVMLRNSDNQTPVDIADQISNTAFLSRTNLMDFAANVEACRHGEVTLARAKWLVTKSFAINALNPQGKTALYRALEQKQWEAAKLLLDNGATALIQPPDADSVLYLALESDTSDMIESILQQPFSKEDVNAASARYWPVLHEALTREWYTAATLLIQRGADINVAVHPGDTLLHYAVQRGSTHGVQQLLDTGADPNATNSSQNTPLHLAAKGSNVLVCKMLVSKGADHTLQNSDNQTPADIADVTNNAELSLYFNAVEFTANMEACQRGDMTLSTARWLVSMNFPVNDTNAQGKTALYRALEQKQWEAAKFLLDNGATALIHPPDSDSCLHLALESDTSDIIESILQQPFKTETVNEPSARYRPLLHEALARKWGGAAMLLIHLGADINAAHAGDSPLHIAATHKSPAMLLYLAWCGADFTKTDDRQRTPLDIFHWHHDVYELLSVFNTTEAQNNETFLKSFVFLAVELKNRPLVEIAVTDVSLQVLLLTDQAAFNRLLCLACKQKSIAMELLIQFCNKQPWNKMVAAIDGATCVDKKTALQWAIKRRCVESVKFLTRFPPVLRNVSQRFKTRTCGNVALQDAITGRNIEIVRVMLQANVDIGHLLHHSITKRKNSNVSLLLLEHGASVKAKPRDRDRLTALHRAIIYRQWPVVQYFLDHSEHWQMIHTVAEHGLTVLHDAVFARNLALVRKLCCHQVAINSQIIDGKWRLSRLGGWTPLHLAVVADRNSRG